MKHIQLNSKTCNKIVCLMNMWKDINNSSTGPVIYIIYSWSFSGYSSHISHQYMTHVSLWKVERWGLQVNKNQWNLETTSNNLWKLFAFKLKRLDVLNWITCKRIFIICCKHIDWKEPLQLKKTFKSETQNFQVSD